MMKAATMRAVLFHIAISLLLTGTAFAGSIELSQQQEHNPSSEDDVRLFTAAADGGFLLLGRTNGSQKGFTYWVEKWNPDYSVLKRQNFTTNEDSMWLTFLAAGEKSPFLVGGHVHVKQTEADLKSNGQASYETMINLNADFSVNASRDIKGLNQQGISFVDCAIQDHESLILAGWKNAKFRSKTSKDGVATLSVPWVARIGKDGTEWEQTFSEDSGVALAISLDQLGRSHLCSQELLKTKDGNIIAAFTATAVDIHADSDGGYIDNTQATNGPQRNFIVKIDAQGAELARWHSAGEADESLILESDDGYVLIDNFRFNAARPPDDILKLQQSNNSADQAQAFASLMRWTMLNPGGVRFTTLDKDLKPLKVVKSTAVELNSHLTSIVKSKNGGYYVVGCGLEKGVALAYLNSNGSLVNVTDVNPSKKFAWCNSPGMALDVDGEHVVFLVGQRNEFGPGTKYWIYRAVEKQ